MKERKRIYCENPVNSAKRQQGFLFGYAENDRFFDVFMGLEGMRDIERKEEDPVRTNPTRS